MRPGKTLRETQDQLLIDMALPASKGCERMKTNLHGNGVDRLPEAYDMIPHSSIKGCFELFGITENVARFLEDSMRSWRIELMAYD